MAGLIDDAEVTVPLTEVPDDPSDGLEDDPPIEPVPEVGTPEDGVPPVGDPEAETAPGTEPADG